MSDDAGSPGSYTDSAIQAIVARLLGARAADDDPSGISLSGISPTDLRTLLGTSRLASFDDNDEDEDYEDEDDEDYVPENIWTGYLGRSAPAVPWNPPVTTEPQAAGTELLNSGDFGYVGSKHRARSNYANVTRAILDRAIKPPSFVPREDIQTNLVPNTHGTTVAKYDSNIYTAQFSDDSSFYYTCAQDFKLHIFDMKRPSASSLPRSQPYPRRGGALQSTMPLRKEIDGQQGYWTITDANLSPDNARIIYSTMMSTVYMTSTSPDGSSEQIPIPFGDSPRSNQMRYHDPGIWSCRFSADGNEVVAGGSQEIFVYDLTANKRTVKIYAHKRDVNSCCWADPGSGNVLISASDDSFLKVWDRRSLGASHIPSGVLIGHTEGITYVSAKGDGRYIISNGKDQAVRLWDLRMMRSNKEHEAVAGTWYGHSHFDYRNSLYAKPRHLSHPKDCSVMTYRGHSVLRTLIRCHFSPAETTGSQYIYSGSKDGRIHIWSLDGRIVQVLDRSKTLPMSYSPSGPEPGQISSSRVGHCVRDVSWHSQEPVMMSAAWSSYNEGTSIARHEWKGLSKMHWKLEDWVQKAQQEAFESSRPGSRTQSQTTESREQHFPGSFNVSDDDEPLHMYSDYDE